MPAARRTIPELILNLPTDTTDTSELCLLPQALYHHMWLVRNLYLKVMLGRQTPLFHPRQSKFSCRNLCLSIDSGHGNLPCSHAVTRR